MSYISGPAILQIGSGPTSIYLGKGLKRSTKTATGTVDSDMWGEQGKFVKSRKTMLTGTPEGIISSGVVAALYANGGGGIGSSLFTATDVPCVVWTKAGQKITWQRAAVTKMPGMKLTATGPIYSSDIEVTCLGAATTSGQTTATAAAHWNAVTSAAFTDATYDPTKIKRYRYTAAFGSSPYDAMTAQEGFDISFDQTNDDIPDDNVGIADIVLKSVAVSAKFIPSNLTEAQLDTLIALQGASAVLPGDLLTSTNDLVIAGADASSGFQLTITKPGFADDQTVYNCGKLRAGEVVAYAARTFTTGAMNPLWTFTLS